AATSASTSTSPSQRSSNGPAWNTTSAPSRLNHPPRRSRRTVRGVGGHHGYSDYTREPPGMSAFALEDGVVYHAYSAHARGLDPRWGHVPMARRHAGEARAEGTGPPSSDGATSTTAL